MKLFWDLKLLNQTEICSQILWKLGDIMHKHCLFILVNRKQIHWKAKSQAAERWSKCCCWYSWVDFFFLKEAKPVPKGQKCGRWKAEEKLEDVSHWWIGAFLKIKSSVTRTIAAALARLEQVQIFGQKNALTKLQNCENFSRWRPLQKSWIMM